jgi:hypothetical protein
VLHPFAEELNTPGRIGKKGVLKLLMNTPTHTWVYTRTEDI